MVMGIAKTAAPRALGICVAAVIVIGMVVGWPAAGAAATGSCPDAAHRFETFSLFAPALERDKQILVYLPPG